MTMNSDDFVALFKRLSVVGACLSHSDLRDAERVSVALQRFSRQEFRQKLHERSERPVLLAFLSDGWGTSISETTAAQFPGSHVRVLRNGRYRHEFLLMRAVYRFADVCAPQVGQIFAEPIGLHDGKSAMHIFSGALDFCATVRGMGHVGIATSVYIQDGAMHSALSKLFQARHSLYYTDGPDLGSRHVVLENTDWVLCLRCVSHCASSAVKWGLQHVSSDGIEDNVFIAIAGLRNSSAALISKVRAFIVAKVRFSSTRSGSFDERLAFWRCLEVSPDLLEEFADADMVWDGTHLHINDSWQDDLRSVQRIASLVVYCLQWVSFSLTRWVKVGRSARLFFRSLASGVEGLVDMCRQDPAISMYHMNGFSRAKFNERRYLCIAAFSSFPVESCLSEVMSDDRCLRRSRVLRDALDEEMQFLIDLPMFVWERMARHIGDLMVSEVRHLALEAAWRCIGYLHKEVFATFEAYPLRLCQGDIVANLERLREETGVADETTTKIKFIMQAGWPVDVLARGIDMWNDIPCSTDLVEQAHGSGASLMKHHKLYCERTLRCRSVIHQCRALVHPSLLDKTMAKLQAQLTKTEEADVKVSAFQAFYSATSAAVSSEIAAMQPGFVRQQHVLRRCRALFAALTRRTRREWENRARAMQERKLEDQSATCASLASIMRLEQQRSDEWIEHHGAPNHMDSCRLDLQSLERLVEVFNSTRSASVEDWQANGLPSPSLPSEEQQALLLRTSEKYNVDPRACPWWARHFALNRDLFRGTALFVEAAETSESWLFLLATQKPLGVVFLRLRRRDRILPDFNGNEWRPNPLGRTEFDVLPWQCVEDRCITVPADSELSILPDLRFEDGIVFTYHPSEPFESFVRRHPHLEVSYSGARASRAQPVKPRSDREKLRCEFPWLTEEDLDRACGFTRIPAGKRSRLHEASFDDELADEPPAFDERSDDQQEEVDIDVVREQLACVRAQYEEDLGDDDGFHVKILGGKWTAEHIGTIADRVSANARGQAAMEWCAEFKWPRMTSFAFNRYSEVGAVELAREVARRANHFYRLWLWSDDDPFRYTPEHLESYIEDFEWLDWMCAQDPNSVSFARGQLLRQMLPKNP